MKKTTLAFLLAVASSACAAPLKCATGNWDVNPMAFHCDDGAKSFRFTGSSGLAVYTPAQRSAKMRLSARVVPEAVTATNTWATLGIAFADSSGVSAQPYDYWHVALVQAPQEHGARHYFELCEMREGRWLAQSEDGLRLTKRRETGTWEYGKPYDLVLEVDAAGISGTVRDGAGKVLFEASFAWPAPLADGSLKAVTCGVPALHSTGAFAGAFSAVDAELSDPRPAAERQEKVVPYASDSFCAGVTGKATGFFHVVKQGDGRWWAIDPLGRGVAILGIDHVTYHGHYSTRTKRHAHLEHNKVQFPDKKDWEANTLARLKDWGFNMLGAGCDPALMRRGLIHTIFLSMGDGLCWDGSHPDQFICPNEKRPCSAFPNVFHPKFAAWADYVARRRCAPNKNDPWLFGYFIDNELAWWGRGTLGGGLFETVANLPDSHTAKIAQNKFLAERGVKGKPSDDVKLDFLKLAADIYFRVTSEAIRRHDPNHLVMGARFAGIGGAHPAVWEASGRYCDVVTFNCYPWADLDRNVMLMEKGSGANLKRVTDAFAKQYGLVNRPMLITEWSFPALDSGLPCTWGAGQRFKTQDLRTRATELFAKTMLSLPFILGYDYFMWVDQPAAGMSDEFPEDSNYGLITEQGVAYPGITSMFKRLHADAGAWRVAQPPQERTDVPPASGVSASEFAARFPAIAEQKSKVTIERAGNGYAVRNSAGLELRGRLGGRYMFDSVRLGGDSLGSYTGMLCDEHGGSLQWHDAARVVSADVGEENGRKTIAIASEGGRHPDRVFRMTHKITVFPDRPWFLCELVSVENVGAAPIDVKAHYFREYSPFAFDAKDAKHRSVPNLWKASANDTWVRASDGLYYGGFSLSPTVTMFRYSLMNGGKSQHPDAMFSPDEPLVLAPGKVYRPGGSMWMLSVGGRGGRAGFDAVVKELSAER